MAKPKVLVAKPYRWRWEVAPYAGLGGLLGWKITLRTAPLPAKVKVLQVWPKKLQAIKEAVMLCREHAEEGQPSELYVKTRMGRVHDSRTYLFDPPGRG
jgi:hypothetical protein